LSFVRHQFELQEPQEDGTPLLAHLEAASEGMGKLHPILADAPLLPPSCAMLWGDFLELHGARGSTGFGPMRITFADLQAWQVIRGAQLSPWEVDCIRKADDLWLNEFAPKPKADA